MKIAVFLDDVSNAIDNAMQRAIMSNIMENINGIKLQIIDPIKIGKEKAIQIILKQDYDALLTYNKTGTNLTHKNNGTEEYVLSNIERKHIAWLTEHPVTFYEQYKASNCNRHYIFTNKSHAFFASNMGLIGSYSVQTFGSKIIKKIKPYRKRKYDICIAAQWRGPAEGNAFWSTSKGKSRQFFEDVLYLQDTIEDRDIYTAFLAAAKHHNVGEDQILKAAPAMRAMYWYARKKERIKLVKDLSKTGLKIALIGGDGWNNVIQANKNIDIIPPIRHEHLNDWYLNSKFVATMNNYNGANERVFDAMAAGCGLFSENAPNLKKQIGSDTAIYYEPNLASEHIPILINNLNNLYGEDAAIHNNKQFLEKHTWFHRGKELKNILDHCGSFENI